MGGTNKQQVVNACLRVVATSQPSLGCASFCTIAGTTVPYHPEQHDERILLQEPLLHLER